MQRSFLLSVLLFSVTLSSCKKEKSCDFDMCDSRRKTIFQAENWTGTLGYYNDLRKWAINVPIPNTVDGLRTCIVCTDIPDNLKTLGRTVTFSGEVKESCGSPAPQLGGQEIYFVTPTAIK